MLVMRKGTTTVGAIPMLASEQSWRMSVSRDSVIICHRIMDAIGFRDSQLLILSSLEWRLETPQVITPGISMKDLRRLLGTFLR